MAAGDTDGKPAGRRKATTAARRAAPRSAGADGGAARRDPWEEWIVENRAPPDKDVFEVGLVLAGAVSAGAYTAGVLDFLLEALEAWRQAKDRGDDVPRHEVRIRVITGASAGGMNGAIAAAAARYALPPAPAEPGSKSGSEPGAGPGNPFYSAWVEQLDIEPLLSTDDLEEAARSLLNAESLDGIAASIVSYQGPAELTRPYLADPLPIMLTVTNLRGVPYSIDFNPGDAAAGQGGGEARGSVAHHMRLHQDVMTFAVTGHAGHADGRLPAWFVPLDGRERGSAGGGLAPEWQGLVQAALATGAFPVGLQARVLSRSRDHYGQRRAVIDRSLPEGEAERIIYDVPTWPAADRDTPYDFLCVDGGAMDNEPFEVARRALAGIEGHNPREGDKAHRAAILIDPFVEPAGDGPSEQVPMARLLPALFGAFKNQARLSANAHSLAAHESVYSRFMVAPSRDKTRNGEVVRDPSGKAVTVKGNGALATSGLGAFVGFFCRDFRHHDYILGRRNCQWFLKTAFCVTADNKHVQGTPDDSGHKPIIPCVGLCEPSVALPLWPSAAGVDRKRLAELIHNRVVRFVDRLTADLLPRPAASAGSLLSRIKQRLKAAAIRTYVRIGIRFGRPKLEEKVRTLVFDALDETTARYR